MSALPLAPADLSPDPAAAPLPRMVLAHAGMETRLLLRNGEQLLLALVIPLIVLVGGALAHHVVHLGSGRPIDELTPGVLALAVLSTSFTSLAIATGFERRYGVLKRLGASPLPRTGLLAGKALSVLAIEAGQFVLVGVVAAALGWHPAAGVAVATGTVALWVVGSAAHASLALLMAGSLRAEATLAAANLVYLVLLALGAVIVPLASYPAGMRTLVSLLPSGALAEGLRQTLTGAAFPWATLAVLVAWTAVAAALTARTFRWE
jgi:ABC-2 type transport system permease protein